MAHEQTWENDTKNARTHFAIVKKQVGRVPGLEVDCFRYLLAALHPIPK